EPVLGARGSPALERFHHAQCDGCRGGRGRLVAGRPALPKSGLLRLRASGAAGFRRAAAGAARGTLRSGAGGVRARLDGAWPKRRRAGRGRGVRALGIRARLRAWRRGARAGVKRARRAAAGELSFAPPPTSAVARRLTLRVATTGGSGSTAGG